MKPADGIHHHDHFAWRETSPLPPPPPRFCFPEGGFVLRRFGPENVWPEGFVFRHEGGWLAVCSFKDICRGVNLPKAAELIFPEQRWITTQLDNQLISEILISKISHFITPLTYSLSHSHDQLSFSNPFSNSWQNAPWRIPVTNDEL